MTRSRKCSVTSIGIDLGVCQLDEFFVFQFFLFAFNVNIYNFDASFCVKIIHIR